MTRPVCADADSALFFPEKADAGRHALEICLTVCPLLTACGERAVRDEFWNGYGIIGGLTVRDRQAWRAGRLSVAQLHDRNRVRLGLTSGAVV